MELGVHPLVGFGHGNDSAALAVAHSQQALQTEEEEAGFVGSQHSTPEPQDVLHPVLCSGIQSVCPSPLPLPYTQPVQPFSQPPVPQTGSGRAPAYEEYHPLTLKLNTPLV